MKTQKLYSLFIFLLLLIVNAFIITFSVNAQEISYPNSRGPAGITLQRESPSGVEVNFSINTLNIDDVMINGLPMKNIRIPEVFLPNDEGAPDLPGLSRFIAVPQGASVRLNVTSSRTETYQNLEIAPAPRIPKDNDDGPLVFKKNETIYSKNAFYPENPVMVSDLTKIRGVDVVVLGITPFQYNPVTKELVVYRDISIELNFEGGNGHFGEDRLRSRWWDPILQDMIFNRASLPKIDYNLRKETGGCEYLIIRPNNPEYVQWADSVKRFRTMQGIITDVVSISQAGGNNASALENYINGAYNNWEIPPCAVLLLGDYGTSVSNNIISPIYNNYCVSDNILADVNGNHMPDIAFARITANDAAQLQVMVSKFLKYERNPPTSSSFYDHPITALGWQTVRWFQICSETIGGFWKNVQGKHPVRINAVYAGNPSVDPWSTATNTQIVLDYFGPNGQNYIPATPQALGGWTGGNATMINNAINSGSFMLQHRDHGGETGWGEPAYHNSDINGLTNTDLTFIMSINCLTGRYNWSSECFTEKFHRYTYNNQNSGALGLIAASQTSYSFVNDCFVWGMIDNFWPNYMPTFGAMFSERGVLPAFGNCAGKYFLAQSSWPYNTNNKEVTYHLFHHHGDAFLTVYSEVPQNLNVTHNSYISEGDTNFVVTADSGAFIGLSINGQLIGRGTATGSPLSITVIGGQHSPDSMDIVITKQNYFRYHSKVPVTPLVSVKQIEKGIPERFTLSQNYPNPFNPVTRIKFGIPKSSYVELSLFDVLGREVLLLVNKQLNAGYYVYEFNGSELPSGIYFYTINTPEFRDTKKMVLVK